jgi:predicted nucleotidyltransferase
MNLSNPFESLFPGGHGQVLRVLLQQPQPLSGRSIALLLGGKLGKSRVLEILGQLVDAGIVDRDIVGSAHKYLINRDHISYPQLARLSNPVGQLVSLIQRHIASWEIAPARAVVFGSTAKHSSTSDSDLDLLILRPDNVSPEDEVWGDQTFRLTIRLERATGLSIQLVEYSESEYQRLEASGARLPLEIRDASIEISTGHSLKLTGS